MPAFLLEDAFLPVNIGIQDRVQIHVHQVFEIRIIAAGDRVDGLVGIGHGVEEGIERALGQLNKRILDREIPGSAQDGMLHNMGYAGGILRRGPEADVEDLVLIFRGQEDDPGPGLDMAEQVTVQARILQPSVFDQLILIQVILIQVIKLQFFCHVFSLSSISVSL